MTDFSKCTKVDSSIKVDRSQSDESEIEIVEEIDLDKLIDRLNDEKFTKNLPDNDSFSNLFSEEINTKSDDGFDAILRGWYGTISKPRWCPKQSKFGARNGKHEGVDIAMPKGTVLNSIVNGNLEWKPNGKKLGHRVWINFLFKKAPYTLIYGHLDKKIGKTPRKVKTGEKVAIAGCTGNTTFCPKSNCVDRIEDHVHLRLVNKNGVLDPVPFFKFNLEYYNDNECYFLDCP